MTSDQIVTDELLAGLTKCPFCGANQTRIQFGDWATYACLSSLHVEQKASRCRSIVCEQRELATIRARVKELEEAGDRMAKIVGQKGDPALWVEETECDEAVKGWNKTKKGTKP